MKLHRIAFAVVVLLASIGPFAPNIPAGNEDGKLTPPPSPSFYVEGLEGLDRKIDLNFRDTRLRDVLEFTGRHAGFVVDIPPNLRNERISLRVDDVTVSQALTILGQRYGVAYSAPRSGHLQVHKSPLLAGVGDVSNPTLIQEFKVAPVYPDSMRDAGIEGHVILQVVVDDLGNVGEVSALKVDPEGQPEMIANAIDAVRQWQYTPGTRHDGKPVDVYVTIYVAFSLK